MPDESSTTYCEISRALQAYQAVFFAIVLAIFLALAGFLASMAPSVRISSALAFLLLAFLALPFFAAWAVEIFFIRKTFRFSLQKGFLFVRSGSINPNYEIVPYENVQDAQVSQGIFERMFGIANVYVSTPAGTAPVFGIKLASAQEFRKDLLALAKMHRGMAE